ncbi:hypothetical protein M3Y99_00291000 [Aphelenchoides fujianensis]|nr:hypothetical protein M3Y99_00291000 [Aphelenchoides fujianensis]
MRANFYRLDLDTRTYAPVYDEPLEVPTVETAVALMTDDVDQRLFWHDSFEDTACIYQEKYAKVVHNNFLLFTFLPDDYEPRSTAVVAPVARLDFERMQWRERVRLSKDVVLLSFVGPASGSTYAAQCWAMVGLNAGAMMDVFFLPAQYLYRFKSKSPTAIQTAAYFLVSVVQLSVIAFTTYFGWRSLDQRDYGPLWFVEDPIPTLLVGNLQTPAFFAEIVCTCAMLSASYLAAVLFARLTALSPLLAGAFVAAGSAALIVGAKLDDHFGDIAMIAIAWSPVFNLFGALCSIKNYREFCVQRLLPCRKRSATVASSSSERGGTGVMARAARIVQLPSAQLCGCKSCWKRLDSLPRNHKRQELKNAMVYQGYAVISVNSVRSAQNMYLQVCTRENFRLFWSIFRCNPAAKRWERLPTDGEHVHHISSIVNPDDGEEDGIVVIKTYDVPQSFHQPRIPRVKVERRMFRRPDSLQQLALIAARKFREGVQVEEIFRLGTGKPLASNFRFLPRLMNYESFLMAEWLMSKLIGRRKKQKPPAVYTIPLLPTAVPGSADFDV